MVNNKYHLNSHNIAIALAKRTYDYFVLFFKNIASYASDPQCIFGGSNRGVASCFECPSNIAL